VQFSFYRHSAALSEEPGDGHFSAMRQCRRQPCLSSSVIDSSAGHM